MMVVTKVFYLTYKGKGTYNVGKYSFMSGKTLEVDEKTYKRLVSPLFSGRIGKVKREEPEAIKANDEPEVVKVEDKPKDRKGKKDKKG